MKEIRLENEKRLRELRLAECEVKMRSILKSDCENRAEMFCKGQPYKNYKGAKMRVLKATNEMKRKSAEDYAESVERYTQLRCSVDRAIKGLKDTELQQILYWRYFDGFTVEDIAQRLFYSVRTVKYKCSRALDEIRFS